MVLSGFLPMAFFPQKISRQDRLRATIPNSVDLGHPSFGYLSPTFIGPEFGVVSWFLLVQGWVTVFSHGLSAHLDAMGVVDQAVEDAVGDGGTSDLLVPARDR